MTAPTKSKTEEIIEFGAVLAREYPHTSPHMIATQATAFIDLARKHHRLAEAACNRELTGAERKAYDEITTQGLPRILTRLQGAEDNAISDEARAAILVSGDPRGATVKLKLPSGKTNDFGGEGWCPPL